MNGKYFENGRSNNCANEINSLLGYAISGKYIENNFDESVKTQVSYI